MVGRSSFSRVIPGGATVFRATSARNIAHTGRRRSPARASDADFRVSMQGGNMRSSLWQKRRMRRSAALALRRKASSTSRPSGVLLLSYPRSSLRIVPFRLPAPLDISRVSGAMSPVSIPDALASGSSSSGPRISLPGLLFSSGVDGASALAAASAGDCPFRARFPLGRGTVFPPRGRTAFRTSVLRRG